MVNEENASKIAKDKSNTPTTPMNQSEVSEGLGSFPQKFAYYDQNTFFAENCLIDKKIERKNTNFINEEIKSQENQAIFKKTLKIMEKHLNDVWCPLNSLKNNYLVILKSNYKVKGNFFSENAVANGVSLVKKKKTDEEQKIIKDIDCFLSLFRTCLVDFYHISKNVYINENPKLKEMFSQETFRYFIINYFFFEEEFYNMVFDLEMKKNWKEEESFLLGVKKINSLTLEDFGVSKELILNENPLVDSENQNNYDHSTVNYTLAIDCIKNLQYIKSPVHKLKSVVLCGIMIKKAIEDFYFKKNKRINMNMISPREFIRIYFFAIYKSKIIHMAAHLSIIQDFIHKNILENLKLPFFKYFMLSVEFFKNAKKMSKVHNNYQFSLYLEDFLSDHDFA